MRIEAGRAKRYKDKLELIGIRTDEIREWLPKSEKAFLSDEKTKLAIYKAFQELAEAALDIIAMIVKDVGKVPHDDYSNLQQLVKEKVLSQGLANVLAEANGLRNVLVHRYNSIEDLRAFNAIKTLLPNLQLDEIKKWLRARI